ncbi:MAG: MFS transporter [Candidatus Omnitrophota bacterium]
MFSSFKIRDFRLFWVGSFISLTGTWLQQVALSWLIFKMTGSSLLLGLVGFFSSIPIFMFSLFGGVIADRVQKRKVLIFTQTLFLVSAFILGTMTQLKIITTRDIIIIAFLNGVILAFDAPLRQAMVVEVVGRPNLLNAIALNSAAFNSARFIGPALAGILIASIGMAGCFYLNAVSFLAVIFALILMRTKSSHQNNKGRFWFELKEGLLFIKHDRVILALLTTMGVLSLFGISYVILLPVFVIEVFKKDAVYLGYLMSFMGLGALFASLCLAKFSSFRIKGKILLSMLLGFSGILILFGINKSFKMALFYVLLMGYFSVICMAIINTLLQISITDEFRGRVLSVFTLTFLGLSPFGNLLAGWLAYLIQAPLIVSFGGIICVVLIIVIRIRNPEVFRLP